MKYFQIEGLEPKGPICIFGEKWGFGIKNDPFNTKNHFLC